MTRAIPIISLVLAASAVALAMFPRESPPATVISAPAPRDDDELDALKRKVDLIEEDQRAMWNRVLLLERKAVAELPADGGAASPVLVAEVAQLKQELRALMQGEVLNARMTARVNGCLLSEGNANSMNWTFAQILQRLKERRDGR